MSKEADEASRLSEAKHHLGTEVVLKWAEWQKKRGYPALVLTSVFSKDDARLLVYQYQRALCVAMKIANKAPKVRAFREWREPYATVKEKLLQRGWTILAEQEVSHGAH